MFVVLCIVQKTVLYLYSRGGKICSTEESFAENQKRQRVAKSVCSGNINAVKNASIT